MKNSPGKTQISGGTVIARNYPGRWSLKTWDLKWCDT
jgi:hypothetical protein